MKNKGTWILLGLVVLLGVYTYFGDFKRKESEEKAKEEQSKVVALAKDQINAIEILREKEPLTLVKAGETWMVEAPLKDAAAPEMVDQFLTEIIDDKSLRVAKEGEKIVWADYGLDDPLGTVVLKTADGKSAKVSVGRQKDFQGNHFLRRDEEAKVLVGNSTWSGRVAKSGTDFRERKVFRQKTADIEKIRLRNSKGEFTLVRKDGVWVNEGQPAWQIDQAKAGDFLTGIGNAKALEFLDPASPALKTSGLAKPSAEVRLFAKGAAGETAPTWTLQVAKSKDNVFFGKVSEPDLTVKLDAFEAGKLLEQTEYALRDGKLPFALATADVKQIDYKSPRHDLVLNHDGAAWKVEKAPPEHEAQMGKVTDLLTKIRDAQVTHFLDSKTQNLFKNAVHHLKLVGGDGKDLLALDWTAPMKLKLNGAETNVVLMKTTAFAEPFAMDEGTVKAWDVDQISKAKAPPPPPPGTEHQPATGGASAGPDEAAKEAP